MSSSIIGERIADLRKKSGEKQEELAQILGCNRGSLANYETGKRTPDIDTIIKIAKHYNTTTDYLFGITDNKTTDIEIRGISDYTGLTEKSIMFLHSLKRNVNVANDPNNGITLDDVTMDIRFLSYINVLLTSKDFRLSLLEINNYQQNICKCIDNYELATSLLKKHESSEIQEDLNSIIQEKEVLYRFALCSFYESQRYYSNVVKECISADLKDYEQKEKDYAHISAEQFRCGLQNEGKRINFINQTNGGEDNGND